MTEREKIIERIREALTLPAPLPGHHAGGATEPALPAPADHRRVMPAVGSTFDEQLHLFSRNAADLRAVFHRVKDEAELAEALRALARSEGWSRLASHRGTLSSPAAASIGLPVLGVDEGYDKTELAACDAGLSECDALVAQAGRSPAATSWCPTCPRRSNSSGNGTGPGPRA